MAPPKSRTASKKGKGTDDVQRSSKWKSPQEDESDLAMSEEEMYRVIRETGILGDSFASASSSSSRVSMPRRPPQDTGRFEELAHEVDGDDIEEEHDDEMDEDVGNGDEDNEDDDEQLMDSDSASIAPVSSPRKLVELIDPDEAIPQSQSDSELLDLEAAAGDDTVFRFLLWMIIFGSLWLCLDLMIHAQYGQDRSIRNELGRAINVLPALAFVIYFTSTYSSSYITKAFLLAWSTIGGSYMIHIVNNESYLQVMRRCPVLGTLWIWSIVQLDLPSAVISLAAVAAFVKYKSLTIIYPS